METKYLKTERIRESLEFEVQLMAKEKENLGKTLALLR